MVRFFSSLMLLAVVVQVVRPLGLPGLRRRSDAWKIALGSLFLFAFAVFIRPE